MLSIFQICLFSFANRRNSQHYVLPPFYHGDSVLLGLTNTMWVSGVKAPQKNVWNFPLNLLQNCFVGLANKSAYQNLRILNFSTDNKATYYLLFTNNRSPAAKKLVGVPPIPIPTPAQSQSLWKTLFLYPTFSK